MPSRRRKDLVEIFGSESFQLPFGLWRNSVDDKTSATHTARYKFIKRLKLIPDDELFNDTYEGEEEE